MALVLVKEDGSGLVSANSYASVADGDSYHDGHLYATAWSGASAGDKAIALVMATRLIDSYCRFLGYKLTAAQALQWPRHSVSDVDSDSSYATSGLLRRSLASLPVYLPSDVVPPCVIHATCEMARELLKLDRTGTRAGEGLKVSIVSGSQFTFDKRDKRPVLTETVVALLSRVLFARPGASEAHLTRS